MADSRKKVRAAIRDLESSSTTKHFSTLVYIRKKIISVSGDLQEFEENGGVDILFRTVFFPTSKESSNMLSLNINNTENKKCDLESEMASTEEHWVQLCESDFKKTLDVGLSIMGNICMKEYIRQKIFKLDGVNTIGDILKYAPRMSIQNRACRALTNMALSADICGAIHRDGDIVPRIVELLQETDDVDFQQTLLRSIRILGNNKEHQMLVMKADGITAAGKLLASDHDKVADCCWKTLIHYNLRHCALDFCKQIVCSGCLPTVVKQTQSCDQAKSRSALSIIYSLVLHSDGRPSLGNAGVIQLFMDRTENDKNPESSSCTDAIQALCLMCRESVNRIRMREEGGLQLLFDLLNDEDFVNMHERIVGSFVCFLYDSTSMQILLKWGLVNSLLQQLRKINAEKRKSMVMDNRWDNKENSSDISLDISTDSVILPESEDSSVSDTRTDWLDVSDVNKKCTSETEHKTKDSTKTLRKTCTSPHRTEQEAVEQQSSPAQIDRSSGPSEVLPSTECSIECDVSDYPSNQAQQSTAAKEDVPGPSRRDYVKYSVDSPTYVASACDWSFEEYSSGAKCKQSFSPQPHSLSPSVSGLSPASCISYYSPRYSPEYTNTYQYESPNASPQSSSCGLSPGNNTIRSNAWSPDTRTRLFHNSDLQYSSAEEDEEDCVDDSMKKKGRKDKATARSNDTSCDEPNVNEAIIGACIDELEADKSMLRHCGQTGRDVELFENGKEMMTSNGSPTEKEDVSSNPLEGSGDTDTHLVDSIGAVTGRNNRRLATNEPVTEKENVLSNPLEGSGDTSTHLVDSIGAVTDRNNQMLTTNEPVTEKENVLSNPLEGSGDTSTHLVDSIGAVTGRSNQRLTSNEPATEKENVLSSPLEGAGDTDAHLVECEGAVTGRSNQRLTSVGSHDDTYVKYHTVSDTDGIESNILTLLSLISHLDDPSTFLPMAQLFSTLLDYALGCSCNNSRWYRILSRVCSNPHCFESLLSSLAVLKIYDKLYSHCIDTPDRGCGSTTSKTDGVKEIVSLDKRREDHFRVKGEALMFKLTMQAVSSFGQGLLINKLLKGCTQDRRSAAVSLCFICGRNSSPRNELMIKYKTIDVLLDSLQSPETSNSHRSHIVCGLHYLSQRLTSSHQSLRGNKTSHQCARGNKRRTALSSHSTAGLLELIAEDESHVHKKMKLSNDKTDSNLKTADLTLHQAEVPVGQNIEIQKCTSSDTNDNVDDVNKCQHDGSKDNHDVTFNLDDGCSVSAHRATLIRRSSMFSAMLDGHYTESQQSCIPLTHVPSEAFRYVMHWLHGCEPDACDHDDYKGILEANSNLDVCLDILALSDRFLLYDVQEQIARNILQNCLNADTVTHILEFSIQSNCKALAEKCILFAIRGEMTSASRLHCFQDFITSRENKIIFKSIHSIMLNMF